MVALVVSTQIVINVLYGLLLHVKHVSKRLQTGCKTIFIKEQMVITLKVQQITEDGYVIGELERITSIVPRVMDDQEHVQEEDDGLQKMYKKIQTQSTARVNIVVLVAMNGMVPRAGQLLTSIYIRSRSTSTIYIYSGSI